MTPEERSRKARIAVVESWANTTDRRARTAAARKKADWGRHEAAVRAEAEARGEQLTEEQIRQMTEARRRAAHLRLAEAGLRARKARDAAKKKAAPKAA